MFEYSIRHDSDIPIYRQLVDQINAQIRSGYLPTGTQLPTVREMAEKLNLSAGTVKRVYDRLQEMGDIEMTRRRGTFVKYVREDTDSRKKRAMAAIDTMIRQLSDLSFSPAEIHIFVGLKMREWGLKWSGVRIAVVTEYMEMVPRLEKQLSQIGNASVVVWQLRQVKDYPYNIDEQSDVILASPEDVQKLESVLPDRSKLIKVAFGFAPESLIAIAHMKGKTGILCGGRRFADCVKTYVPGDVYPLEKCRREDVDAFLQEPDSIIVYAEGTETGLDDEIVAYLEKLKMRRRAFSVSYGIDEGSMIYLEERINRIRDQRQLRPAGMDFWNDGDMMGKHM